MPFPRYKSEIYFKDNTFDMKTEWHPVPISQETAI